MQIPPKFLKILEKSQTNYSIVLDVITSFESILKDNKLYFFEEYTDHGIDHIESVLKTCEFIITDESYQNINPNEIVTLILAIILHDLGMHLEFSTFKALLSGDYDDVKCSSIDYKTWGELWNDYLTEVKRFNTYQKQNIFGDENLKFKVPDLSNKDNLDGIDKKVIGEFIRRNHPRIAHEIALKGLIGNSTIDFATEELSLKNRQIIGVLARSHGMNIRDCFPYLEVIGNDSWRNPLNINIIYLMVIIRIADYIQISSSRVNPYLLKVKTFNSPISSKEHKTHLAIEAINYNQSDSEKIYVECAPKDSAQYVKIFELINDIQKELDTSWAILGEIYGFIPTNKPAIKFRRISSNLENRNYLNNLNYLPQKIGFHVDNNLSRLLVAPLYGDNPTFGVRELLQNAIDSCLEMKELEYSKNNFDYIPQIIISLERIDEETSLFTISDNGKGMNEYEIINYFLSVGTSFRKSMDWKKKFVDEKGKSKVQRNGKFGIGVLAVFLLGDEIDVETKSFLDNSSYSFKTSIESQSINISKSNTLKGYGAKVSTIINNEKRGKLLSKHYTESSTVVWTNWYINKDPAIKFFVDGLEIEIENNYNIEDYHSFKTKDFDSVKWNYVSEENYRNTYYRSFQKLLVCNGIIINKSYKNSRFNYATNIYYKLINDKPSIIVTDKDGVFPLKLDRSDLDSDQFPFEDELFQEVSKHFVAKLLTLKIDLSDINSNTLIHNSKFLYGKNGFTINSEYFLEGLKSLEYKIIKIVTDKSSFNFKTDITRENILTFFSLKESINFNSGRGVLFPVGGCRTFISKKKYNIHFDPNTKRLPKYIKNSITIESENKDFLIYKTRGFKDSFLLSNLEDIDGNLLNEVQCIQEISYDYFKKNTHSITNDIFRKYIKKNFIIPYDLKERKKIYVEAFDELKEFM